MLRLSFHRNQGSDIDSFDRARKLDAQEQSHDRRNKGEFMHSSLSMAACLLK